MPYVGVQFPGSFRVWTYKADDDSIMPGDTVEVVTPRGNPITLKVVEVHQNDPGFPCKPAVKVHGGG